MDAQLKVGMCIFGLCLLAAVWMGWQTSRLDQPPSPRLSRVLRFLIASAITGALALGTGGCGMGTAYSHSQAARPTIVGNGSQSQTTVAGLYSDTTGTSPDGAAITNRCIEINRQGLLFAERYAGLGPAYTRSMLALWFTQQALSIPGQCINLTTFGSPVGAGSGVGLYGGGARY